MEYKIKTITDRFTLQLQKWETIEDEEYNLLYLQEMIRRAGRNDKIRIFVSNTLNHIFSRPEVVETISDYIENDGNVEILVNPFTTQDIFSSGLLSRVVLYQSLGKTNLTIKKSRMRFTLSRGGADSFIDYMTVNNSFFVTSTPEDDSNKKEYISCVNDSTAIQSLNNLFDEEWRKIDSISLPLLLNNNKEE